MEETLSPAQAEVNQLVENGLQALDDFLKLDQDQVDYIVAKCSVAALDKHGELAKLAIEETKRGVFEDKATKNLFACEYVVNHMRHLKSVGVIKEDEVQGLTYVAEPVGVVAGDFQEFNLPEDEKPDHLRFPSERSAVLRRGRQGRL